MCNVYMYICNVHSDGTCSLESDPLAYTALQTCLQPVYMPSTMFSLLTCNNYMHVPVSTQLS